MLVQQELQRFSGMRLPVEIGGQRLGRHHVEERAGRAGRNPGCAETLEHAATIYLSAQKCADEVFLLLVHKSSPPLRV
ncbi:hypothetical protein D9M69_704970 [compost metagenome]